MRVHGSWPGTDSGVIRRQSVITSPQAPQVVNQSFADDVALVLTPSPELSCSRSKSATWDLPPRQDGVSGGVGTLDS